MSKKILCKRWGVKHPNQSKISKDGRHPVGSEQNICRLYVSMNEFFIVQMLQNISEREANFQHIHCRGMRGQKKIFQCPCRNVFLSNNPIANSTLQNYINRFQACYRAVIACF